MGRWLGGWRSYPPLTQHGNAYGMSQMPCPGSCEQCMKIVKSSMKELSGKTEQRIVNKLQCRGVSSVGPRKTVFHARTLKEDQ